MARREPNVVTLYIRDNFVKVSISAAAMAVFALGTFTYLYTHQTRPPDAAPLASAKSRCPTVKLIPVSQ